MAQSINRDREVIMHECEECWDMVPAVLPCYWWDRNSMRVCGPCGARIRSEFPEGDRVWRESLGMSMHNYYVPEGDE